MMLSFGWDFRELLDYLVFCDWLFFLEYPEEYLKGKTHCFSLCWTGANARPLHGKQSKTRHLSEAISFHS